MSEMEHLNAQLDGSSSSQLAIHNELGAADALISSINADHLEAVEQALLRGEGINDTIAHEGLTNTPLTLAIYRGHTRTIKKLLELRADPNLLVPAHGSAVVAAVSGGNVDIVQLLLDAGAIVDLQLTDRIYGSALLTAGKRRTQSLHAMN
jgi:ankyrin repeat protein